MPDFSKLYKSPAGIAVKPKALPARPGYIGIIKGHELVEPGPSRDGRPRNYETIIRFQVGLLEWPEDVDQEDRQEVLAEGAKPTPINLAGKQLRRDFYDNRLDLLDEFIRSFGVEPKGRTYEEVLPELTGCRVVVEVGQYVNQQTMDMGNQINGIVGEGG